MNAHDPRNLFDAVLRNDLAAFTEKSFETLAPRVNIPAKLSSRRDCLLP